MNGETKQLGDFLLKGIERIAADQAKIQEVELEVRELQGEVHSHTKAEVCPQSNKSMAGHLERLHSRISLSQFISLIVALLAGLASISAIYLAIAGG